MGRGGQASIMMAMGAQVYNDIERRPNLNWKPRWSPYLNLSWNSCLPRKNVLPLETRRRGPEARRCAEFRHE